jgi:drug/metabolite transporter (DMT)-like permease
MKTNSPNKSNRESGRGGIVSGAFSGVTFGLYSAVVAFVLTKDPLAGAVSVFAAPFVVSAINDTLSALWLMIWNIYKGRLKKLLRCLLTKPGLVVIAGAVLGGPVAGGAYLVAINSAGAAAIPISAMYPFFGTVFARFFLKQTVSKRTVVGILLCIAGAAVISSGGSENTAVNFTFGIICAFIAAIGWGAEGVLAVFATSKIDYSVAVNIRQGISGLTVLFLLIPIINANRLLGDVIGNLNIVIIIAGTAVLSAVTFFLWYKANKTAGVAAGMSLNISYVLWGVLFTSIFTKEPLAPVVIAGTLFIAIGAVLVSLNPANKKGEV